MKKYLLFLASCIGVVLSFQAQDLSSDKAQQWQDQDQGLNCVQMSSGGLNNIHIHFANFVNPWWTLEPNGPVGNTPRPIRPPGSREPNPGMFQLIPARESGSGNGILYMSTGNGTAGMYNLMAPGIWVRPFGPQGNTPRPVKPPVNAKPILINGGEMDCSPGGSYLSQFSASGDGVMASSGSSSQPEGETVSSSVDNDMGQSVALAVVLAHGDLNRDDALDVSDVTMLISQIMASGMADAAALDIADYNEDGQLDVSDVTTLISRVMQSNAAPVKQMQCAKQAVLR